MPYKLTQSKTLNGWLIYNAETGDDFCVVFAVDDGSEDLAKNLLIELNKPALTTAQQALARWNEIADWRDQTPLTLSVAQMLGVMGLRYTLVATGEGYLSTAYCFDDGSRLVTRGRGKTFTIEAK